MFRIVTTECETHMSSITLLSSEKTAINTATIYHLTPFINAMQHSEMIIAMRGA